MNEIVGTINNNNKIIGSVNRQGGGSGSSDYNDLINKPAIEGVSLIGDKTLDELNISSKDYTNKRLEEVESIAKGANQSLSFGDYSTMISVFNTIGNNNIYNIGQNVLIITLNVPDLWVSGIEYENIPYTYTTDEDFTNLLKEQGYVQVGYYKLSALETQKVDLTDHVKNTDYAIRDGLHGLVKISAPFGIDLPNGASSPIAINKATDEQIDTKTNQYRPLVPSNLDYAVMKALSDSKLEWTDEQKQLARELLGIILSVGATKDTIPLRDGDGRIYAMTPKFDSHVATKKYVDDKHITLTQAEYDALVEAGTVDENTFYYIKEE